MKPEDFFKTNSAVFSSPMRTTRRIRRFRPERGDGVAAEQMTIRMVRPGQIHELIIEEEAVPSCLHIGAPAIICGHPDPNTPFHTACPSCAIRCFCGRMFCPCHVQEVDGQFLCIECSRKVRLDSMLKGLLGWFGS